MALWVEWHDLAVLGAEQQITLPMARHGAIFDGGRALANGNRVGHAAFLRGVPRVANGAMAAKMGHQLFLQNPARLRAGMKIGRSSRANRNAGNGC